MGSLADCIDIDRIKLCQKAIGILQRKGFPSDCIKYDTLFFILGQPILRFDLLQPYIDPDCPDGVSYSDYFNEKFGDQADLVARAFGFKE